MSNLTIRIVVTEPVDWSFGNLFGEIISERNGDSIKVRLTQKVIGRYFSSDLLLLTALSKDETFKPLQHNYSVTVNGNLINEETNEQDFIIIGNVIYD